MPILDISEQIYRYQYRYLPIIPILPIIGLALSSYMGAHKWTSFYTHYFSYEYIKSIQINKMI